MPGGFTWADVFAGFSEAVLAGVTLGAICVGIGLFVLGCAGVSVLAGSFMAKGLGTAASPRDDVRAMAHERMARREAVPDWGQDGIYPERKAS